MAVFEAKGTALAIAGIVAIVLIAGLMVAISAEKTGKVVTYRNSIPGGCYSTPEDACMRNMHCKTWEGGIPVVPQPTDRTPPGYVACRCRNKLDPNAYGYFLMCA